MKEPRLQMRLKKQLSGGRVPHLLRGQGNTQEALSQAALGCSACSPYPEHAPGGSRSSSDPRPALRSHPMPAHLTRGMWSSVQQEPGLSTPHDWL